jgi:hypothetical protein
LHEKVRSIAIASLVLASAATPQDVAPDGLLLRIRSHMHAELSHLPDYTCLETMSRFRRDRRSQVRSHGLLTALDTVRLEIVYSDHREWFGSPGGGDLRVDNPAAFIGGGMIGNGAFGLMLDKILAEASFTYRGEESLGGRTAVRYDFRLSRAQKPLELSVPGGAGTVGEEGSLWVDPQSLDLVRMESRADEIPPYLPVKDESTDVDYARTRIGGNNALLAQQAGSHLLDADGVESYNHIEFTHCRAYSTQSELHFDGGPPGPPGALPSGSPPVPSSPDAVGHAVPAFLPIALDLTTPISDGDAVGTLIEARVSDAVLHKGKIVVPKGSVVHGRIRRLERFKQGIFIVGLEFTEVEVGGDLLPFYADFLRTDKNPRIQVEHTERVLVPERSKIQVKEETITLPELPGVASFFVSGTTFTLPRGFHMVWRTRGQIR